MINITARGFELKQGTKDGIEKELKRIEKMLPDSAEFDVTLAKKKGWLQVRYNSSKCRLIHQR